MYMAYVSSLKAGLRPNYFRLRRNFRLLAGCRDGPNVRQYLLGISTTLWYQTTIISILSNSLGAILAV